MKGEWQLHQSVFSQTWLTSMRSLGKLTVIDDKPDDFLSETIRRSTSDENVVAAILKDAHLLAGAMRSDRRIASLDDRMRNHIARNLSPHESIMNLVWIDPTDDSEAAIGWLESGAPDDEPRKLRNCGRN